MKRLARPSLLALLALVFALALSACGGDEEPAPQQAGGQDQPAAPTQLKSDPANAQKGTITVGSKNFTEQYVLGEIYAQTLEALGFKVKKRLNLGSEQIAYKALKAGQIDAYPEYTGTALTSFFDVKIDDVPRDPDQAYEQAKAEYAKENITALPRTPFENTYRISSTIETAGKLGNPKTLSELVPKTSALSISGFPECRQRTDCLLGFKQVYDYKGKFVSSEGKFNDLDKGTSDLTFAFSTDPQLALTDKYVGYDDDKKLFPPYNISFGVRNETLEKIGPEAREAILTVQKGLTEEAMRELNRRVELEKQKPEEVAAAYLRESGFIQ
ncbi:MAG: glycine/betaine ABC transporter substrate-binding protein [Actinomycetota bacterium]|nr:glycine/betaine ABC transporter substrate-binding protein [Actinomycetota bacterium]